MKTKNVLLFILLSACMCLPVAVSADCFNDYSELGDKSNEEKKYKESIAFYEKAIRCSTKRKEILAGTASLAVAEYSAGNIENAKKYLKVVLSMSPNNKWAKKFAKSNNIDLSENDRSSSGKSKPSAKEEYVAPFKRETPEPDTDSSISILNSTEPECEGISIDNAGIARPSNLVPCYFVDISNSGKRKKVILDIKYRYYYRNDYYKMLIDEMRLKESEPIIARRGDSTRSRIGNVEKKYQVKEVEVVECR